MTPPRIIPLPDGRFSVSREDLLAMGSWWFVVNAFFDSDPDDAALHAAIDAALKENPDD